MSKPSFVLLLMAVWLVAGCGSKKVTNDEGKQLATAYCGSCHVVPSPSQLDKQSWLLGVLPEMGLRLGIHSFQGYTYTSQSNAEVPAGFYPDNPVLTEAEWEKIVNYFYVEAPDSLQHARPKIEIGLKSFVTKTPKFPEEVPPVSCYVKIDPGNHTLYVAHGTELKLSSYNSKLQLVSEVPTSTVVVDMAFENINNAGARNGVLLNMGELNPRDVTHGSLQAVSVDSQLKLHLANEYLVDSLPRPVSLQRADLNKDGKEDYVVCGYGNFMGSLLWLKNIGGGNFERKILRSQPGSMQTIIRDCNNDGRLDILALMAQGDEGVFLYEQQPDGSFKERNLLRFSPVAGSISIDLADFNSDGFPDLIYTSGDNADYSKVLKPYHGVYIYLNDGKWNFEQKYFFPINGCFKALARDFDLDGDIDLAAISYFPDFTKRPEESFVYLENKGEWNFEASTFIEHSLGRWLTMDAGDIDGDGDLDLLLGNMSIGPSNVRVKATWRKGPAFVLLENKTHQREMTEGH